MCIKSHIVQMWGEEGVHAWQEKASLDGHLTAGSTAVEAAEGEITDAVQHHRPGHHKPAPEVSPAPDAVCQSQSEAGTSSTGGPAPSAAVVRGWVPSESCKRARIEDGSGAECGLEVGMQLTRHSKGAGKRPRRRNARRTSKCRKEL